MRRALAHRRLEAALALLGPVDGTGERPEGIDSLVGDIEAAAYRVGDRLAVAEATTAHLRAALERVAEGVVICDEDGLDVYRNGPAAVYVSGRPDHALAAQRIDEHLAQARKGQVTEQAMELFAPVRRDLTIRAYPLGDPDDPDGRLGAVVIIEDVSERTRVDAIRRDFVANVSHELKTPVGALSLLAETLDGEEDPDVVARLSGRVAMEAARLGRIIDDLLDLSRIEANENAVHQMTPWTTLQEQVLEQLRPVAAAAGIALDTVPGPHGLEVPGDRRDLVSAVSNLVDNAIKYSEDGGCVQVRAQAEDRTIEVTVADRGIGIPRRDLERIFERFYRVDRARSRTTGGTGLGLSIVRHVAANHGGSVRVESTEGVGSTFTLVLAAHDDALRSTCPEEGSRG